VEFAARHPRNGSFLAVYPARPAGRIFFKEFKMLYLAEKMRVIRRDAVNEKLKFFRTAASAPVRNARDNFSAPVARRRFARHKLCA